MTLTEYIDVLKEFAQKGNGDAIIYAEYEDNVIELNKEMLEVEETDKGKMLKIY